MKTKTGPSKGYYGEVLENPHSGLRFMVLAKHRVNPNSWEGRLAMVIRGSTDAKFDRDYGIGTIHFIGNSGWIVLE